MKDYEETDGTAPQHAQKRSGWISRCTNEIKRYFQKRSAQTNATISIAFFAGVTFIVGTLEYCTFESQLTVMRGQLDAMKADQRAWVYIIGADPRTDLIFAEGKAAIILTFQLKNAGRTPARFATVAGEFLMRGGTLEDIRKGWGTCDMMRLKPPNEFLSGTAVFPNQEVQQSQSFTMPKQDVERWAIEFARATAEKANFMLAPLIVGCVDYVYERDNQHHQTRFVYELDKKASNPNTFLGIDPKGGNVSASGIALAKNPGLADNPD